MIKKRTNLFIKITVAALLFVGCQKQHLESSEAGTDTMFMKSSFDNLKLTDANKAFDQISQQVMQDMMQLMNKMEMTCDPDIDFARMMIMHHEAGIKMSQAELLYGHEPEAKALATSAIENDEASIARLEAFLANHSVPEPLSKEECKEFNKQMDNAMKTMMNCMSKFDTDDVDVDFAGRMICHHEGALAMSQILLNWGDDAATLAEAQMIIEEQSMHIMELQEFIDQHD